jgi:hypothetical protein
MNVKANVGYSAVVNGPLDIVDVPWIHLHKRHDLVPVLAASSGGSAPLEKELQNMLLISPFIAIGVVGMVATRLLIKL